MKAKKGKKKKRTEGKKRKEKQKQNLFFLDVLQHPTDERPGFFAPNSNACNGHILNFTKASSCQKLTYSRRGNITATNQVSKIFSVSKKKKTSLINQMNALRFQEKSGN
jgi:hypothetical protein